MEFVAAPALAPPEVVIDVAQQKSMEQDLQAAAEQPLPAEDGIMNLIFRRRFVVVSWFLCNKSIHETLIFNIL